MTRNWHKQFEPLIVLKHFLLTTVSVLVALVLFAFYLVLTPHGAKTTLNLIQYTTPYQVEYQQVQGTLAEGLRISALHVKGPNVELQASDLIISYHVTSILKGNYALDELKAQNLRFHATTLDQDRMDWSEESLEQLREKLKHYFPIPIKVSNIHIQNAQIIVNSYAHQIDKLIIENASEDIFSIKHIHYNGSLGKIDGIFDKNIALKWDLSITDHPLLASYQTKRFISKGSIQMPRGHIEKSHVDMNLELNRFSYNQQSLQDLLINVKGTLLKHQIALNGVYQEHPLQVYLDGRYENKNWQTTIKEIRSFKKPWHNFHGKGQIVFNWASNNLLLDANMIISNNVPFNAHIEIDKATHRLSGNFKSALPDVKQLSFLSSNLSQLNGSISANLTLMGSLSDPSVSGLIAFKDGRIKTTTIGKKAILNALNINLNNNKLDIEGKGTWGKGNFTVTGHGQISSHTMLNLNFKGDKLLLSETPEYYIVGSPDLKISIVNQHPEVVGKIFIDEADIRSLKNQHTISPTDDVVIVSSKKEVKTLPQQTFERLTPIDSKVEIILSDQITYKGYGITTKIGGKLLITQESGQGPNARGKLQFRNGQYKGFGKTFDIEYGQILFSGGPIYNPILDIRAQRTIQAQRGLAQFSTSQPITCGIHFSGYLKTPKISFYSNPTMSDADVMSYLVVGRPQSQIQGAQAEVLYEAVSHLTRIIGSNRDDVQFDLAEQFHLTQIGLSKKDTYASSTTSTSHANNRNPLEDTVFVLGKQLSDKLYLQYSVGILDSASSFGIRYNLGKNVTVEAATGTQGTSADVLLSFEGH